MKQVHEQLRLFNHLVSEINGLYHRAALRSNISDSVQGILYCVCESGESCPQSQIYKRCGVSRQTINSAIRRLERQGIVYLEREKSGKTTVCLTETGRAFAREAIEPLFKIENEIFRGWTPEERQSYLELTRRFRDSLREKLDAPGGKGHEYSAF